LAKRPSPSIRRQQSSHRSATNIREIERAKNEGNKPVARTAFQNDYFAGIDGLIWSHCSTGFSAIATI
jgi:hypothetical protein